MATEPMYRLIADDLRAKIESGVLEQGSQLPTEIELMEQYNASRNTVRDAIKLLTTRTLVETRPGQGTFVVERIKPFVTTLTTTPADTEPIGAGGEEEVYIAEVTAGGRDPIVTAPRVEIQQASAEVARSLRIPEGAPVVSRHQQRFIDRTPWSLQTTFYPMALVEQGATRLLEATTIEGGAVGYLGAKCGIRQTGYRDSIAVRVPNENEVAFFKLPADGRIQVFEIYRTGFAQDGSRIRLTITVYPADRNRFRINIGSIPAPPESTGRESKAAGP